MHLAAVLGVGVGHELRQEDVSAPDGAVPVPGQVAAPALLVLVPLPEAQRVLNAMCRFSKGKGFSHHLSEVQGHLPTVPCQTESQAGAVVITVAHPWLVKGCVSLQGANMCW